jgi:hypothetical protein
MNDLGHRVTILIKALDKLFSADDWNIRNPDKIDIKRYTLNVVEPLDAAWNDLTDSEKDMFIEKTQMHTREYWEKNKGRYKLICNTLSEKGILFLGMK